MDGFQGYADTFSQSPEDVTDLSLPAFEIYEKSKSENGNTIYYGVFYECDYYNLGSDLADLNNPVRTPLCKISSTGEIEQRFRLN